LTTRNAATAKQVWLPSYYEAGTAEVFDATGGGNTYLGRSLQSWKASGDVFEASVYGHVAASFAVEQIGLPAWELSGGEEMWNGVRVIRRLDQYREKLKLFKRGLRTLLRRMQDTKASLAKDRCGD
jgi:bifunctional ADP-heptose synthase (sugar kinase/adenylyltransferase)